jgi:hypothetical protein
MKNLLLILTACGLMAATSGCEAEVGYDSPPVAYTTGTVEYCDDFGCRDVNAPYYYDNGEVVYYDAHFGYWMGPRGYLVGGRWHSGFVGGYHSYYHPGYYHGYRGGYHGGGGFHGGGQFHGGRGGYHGGEHGGHSGGGHGGHR